MAAGELERAGAGKQARGHVDATGQRLRTLTERATDRERAGRRQEWASPLRSVRPER